MILIAAGETFDRDKVTRLASLDSHAINNLSHECVIPKLPDF